MKILQLCKKLPCPVKDGECLAITQLGKSLSAAGAQLDLLAMDTARHPGKVSETLKDTYNQVEIVSVDNRIKWDKALLNLFSSASYHIERFESEAYSQKLKQMLQNKDYDLVQLETIYLAPYLDVIRAHSKAKVVLRAHNIEHEIWTGIEKHEPNFLKSWYIGHLAKKLKAFEVNQLNKVDFIAAISPNDANTFRKLGFKGEMSVVPIGLETNEYAPDEHSFEKEISMGFIGSLDWRPNLEGLRWFLDQIWPDLNAKYPNLKLHIAGRNAPAWLQSMNQQNIVFEGEVPCAKEFINKHQVMLVPLLSGSGMRAKILEGMALGRVVLSTRLGLEGISAVHKSNALMADKPKEFIDSIDYIYSANGQLKKIGEKAIDLVSQCYDRQKISNDLMLHYEKLAELVH